VGGTREKLKGAQFRGERKRKLQQKARGGAILLVGKPRPKGAEAVLAGGTSKRRIRGKGVNCPSSAVTKGATFRVEPALKS